MSAQALATVMGPPLMLHSPNSPNGSEIDHAQPIAVLKYLLQIWPQPQTSAISGNVTKDNLLIFVQLRAILALIYLGSSKIYIRFYFSAHIVRRQTIVFGQKIKAPPKCGL